MKPFAILYATREGQTRRIAEHLAATLRSRGHEAEVLDVSKQAEPWAADRWAAVVLAGSVHAGQHEHELVAFVKRHRDELERAPSAFLSVSMAEAGAEDPRASAQAKAEAEQGVERAIDAFVRATGFHAQLTRPVAGALAYTKYGALIRFVMKRIARKAGRPTDASRDYEYTDWEALDHFADELVEAAGERATAA